MLSHTNPVIRAPYAWPSGSVTLPGAYFGIDRDTGFYRIGANNIGLATNGVLAWDVSATAITHALATVISATGTALRTGPAPGSYTAPSEAPGLLIVKTGGPNTVWWDNNQGANLKGWQVEASGVVAGELVFRALNDDGTVKGTPLRLGGATANLIGFYGTAPIALQTGVAVTAAGVHAALVNLGLIT